MRDDEAIVEPLRRPELHRALNAFTEAVKRGHGRVVFAAGPVGSGRTELLRALRRDVRRGRGDASVVAGGFVNGDYEPWHDDEVDSAAAAKKVKAVVDALLALGEPVVSALPYGPPALSATKLASQIVQTCFATKDLAQTLGADEALAARPDTLKRLLRRAAEVGPMVWLLDDLDRATSRAWWADLVQSLAREIAVDLPVLAVITLTAADGTEDIAAPRRVARRLVENGEGEWWPLRPLERSDLTQSLGPCNDDLWTLLVEATGGNPRWAEDLWQAWRESGAVYQATNGAWGLLNEATTEPKRLLKDLLEDRLRRLIGDDVDAVYEGTRLLGVAALEGREFTADVLALVVERERNTLVDLLDNHYLATDERPLGVLREAGGVDLDDELHGKRHFWRYRFVSDLHWQTLRRYGLSPKERIETSLLYANTLAEAYGPEEEKIAATLAELFADAGAQQKSQQYQRIADFTRELEAVEPLARAWLNADRTHWDASEYAEALSLAIHAGELLRSRQHLRRAVFFFEAGVELARATNARFDEAYCLFRTGELAVNLFEHSKAVATLTAARDYFAERGRRQYEAHVLIRLADVARMQGDYARARTLLAEAMKLGQAEGSLEIQADANFGIGLTYYDEDLRAAKQLVTSALQLRRKSGHSRDGLLRTRLQLGLIDSDLGLTQDALQSLLAIEQEAASRHLALTELQAARAVGDLLQNTGEWADARTHLASALTRSRELETPEEEAKTLLGFAGLALKLSNARLALVCGAIAHKMFSSINHPWAERIMADMVDWLEMDESQTRAAFLPVVDAITAAYEDDGGKAIIQALLHADLQHAAPYITDYLEP